MTEARSNTGLELFRPGDYHLYSAATTPHKIDWKGLKITRWFGIDDPSRTRNAASVFTSRFMSAGLHDVSTLVFYPDSIKEEYFSLDQVAFMGWLGGVTPRPIVEGPSSTFSSFGNYTIQEIDDIVFSKEFLEYLGPSLAQISRLGQLVEGWDSYGARRVEAEARENAAKFLRSLYGIGVPVPPPIVGASPSGAVVLQWLLPHIEIYTEISSDLYEFYVARPDQDRVLQEGTLHNLHDLSILLHPFFTC